jgi:hypothetical protein
MRVIASGKERKKQTSEGSAFRNLNLGFTKLASQFLPKHRRRRPSLRLPLC